MEFPARKAFPCNFPKHAVEGFSNPRENVSLVKYFKGDFSLNYFFSSSNEFSLGSLVSFNLHFLISVSDHVLYMYNMTEACEV